MIMGAQSKAGRNLLGWTQEDLAIRSGVSLASVKRAEAGAASIQAVENAISEAFRAAGIVFLVRGSAYDGQTVAAGVVLLEEATRV